MVEGTPNRPIPEGELKQNAPEAGAGPLGIPPPTPEHSPQGPIPDEEEVPKGLIFSPGHTSLRSLPDSATQEHGELQAGEQKEAEEFDFDLGEFPGSAIFKCSLPYPSHSKPNEEPDS